MKFTASTFTLIASGLFLTVSAGDAERKCVLDDSDYGDEWPQNMCPEGEVDKSLTCQGDDCVGVTGSLGSYWGSPYPDGSSMDTRPVWCIDLPRTIGLGAHCFDTHSSYEDIRNDAIDKEYMLPNVNYLLNNYRGFDTFVCGSGPLTWVEVQEAIWDLVEYNVPATSCLAKKLAWDARENGNDFDPCKAGLENPIFGVVLIVDSARKPHKPSIITNQVLIEEVPATCVPCDDDDPCTNDYCDEYGNCYHEKIENCCVDDDDCKWCKCLKKHSDDETGICKPDPCMWGEWNNDKSECDCMGGEPCLDGFCKNKGYTHDDFLGYIQICDTPKLPADGALVEGFGLCCLWYVVLLDCI